MSTLYRVPLTIDPDEIKAFDMVEAMERNNVYIEASDELLKVFVIGTQDHLAGFFRQIDGPGQSFPITEFVEFIQDYKVEAQ